MSDVSSTNYVPIADLMAKIELYRYNPSNIQRSILNYLDAVTDGKVDVVDPSNPFVFLLESSAVSTASNFMENLVNLRKQYPALAQSVSELYRHMSDKDFENLFATPVKSNFTFMIQYASLMGQMVDDYDNDCKRATIAPNTTVTVDEKTFSLQYPIDVKLFTNGVLQVSYDTTKTSPLQSLSTNIIPFNRKKDSSGVEWLYFTVELSQFKVTSSFQALQSSKIFKQTIAFEDSYYYCRVFYKKGATLTWTEMSTSLTDQVYDPLSPTAILQPNNQTKEVEVFIPPIYLNTGLVDGSVRIDVYQTLGEMSLDMSNFNMGSFSTSLLTLDETNDANEYTSAFNNVSMLVYSGDFVTGGSSAMDFETLRKNVINNSIGNYDIPITNVQLVASQKKNGFQIVRYVDLVTNRKLLATRTLPSPTNSDLITPANATIKTLIGDIQALRQMDTVRDNVDRCTIISSTLYKNVNGKLSICSKAFVESIKRLAPANLCSNVNSNNYLYSPFYYVLDNSADEFEVRPYHLDNPSINNLSFISQNSTVGLTVNTQSYSVTKTDTGYQIAVIVSSDSFYKALTDQYVQAQLCYIPEGEIKHAYINGVLQGKNATTNERVFTFDIETKFDVDRSHNLILTNFEMFSNEFALTASPLKNSFKILYTTNSVPVDYVADAANNIIGSFLLPQNAVVITEETIDLTFGYELSNMWAQSRSVASGMVYETYADDIPMTYEENVYVTDQVTGSRVVFNTNGRPEVTLLHRKGDVVYDSDHQVVLKYRKGDVILDSQGKPKTISAEFVDRHIDILLVDGAYYFATDDAHDVYRKEIASTINTWVTETLADVESGLLDKTEIYFYPTSSIGLINVKLNQELLSTIEAKQSLSVRLYVTDAVHDDLRIRDQLERTTIKTLNTVLKNTIVSTSDIIASLKAAYGSSVLSFSVEGLGGSNNYNTITVINENDSLSLNKILEPQDDGTLIVKEDVSIAFVKDTTDDITT